MIIALATVLGLVTAAVPAVVAADTATDQINAITMPTQGKGNLALESSIVVLSQAADGTLFAGVRDDSGGYRWNVEQGERLYAVFTSTNGYDWTEGYKVSWSDNLSGYGDDPIVAIVPVPDYSKNNTIVYMATQNFVYVSTNGGKTFTTLDAVPGVIYVDNVNYITSLDVAANPTAGTGYVVLVGTAPYTLAEEGGVFTYNENGLAMWKDKQVGNVISYATSFSASPDVYAVKFSVNYATDKVILAVTGDATSGVLTIRGTGGQWGVESLDCAIPVDVTSAKIVLPADYNCISNPVSYIKTYTNIYKVTSIQSPGDPSRKDIGPSDVNEIYDIALSGSQLLAATNATDGGVQVYSSTNPGGYSPAWTPSYKQPIGASNAFLATGTLGTFVACQEGYAKPSGVSKLVAGASGNMAWNGVGLIDTQIATKEYFETSWIGGPVWTEASPNNKVDNTIFMVTYSDYGRPMMVWRTANGGTTWDMICADALGMGDANVSPISDVMDLMELTATYSILTVRTAPTFSNTANSTSQVVYMLGQNNAKEEQWLFKSTDAGNTWKPIIAMPNSNGYYSCTAWCVVNDTTVILADSDGYIYITTDNGYSWTDGALTAYEGTVTSLKYYKDATLGLVVLAGVVDSDDIGVVFISTDGGTTFCQVGTSLAAFDEGDGPAAELVQVDFDNNFNTNYIIYTAFGSDFDEWVYDDGFVKEEQGEAGIWRTTVNTIDPTSSSLWTKIVSTADFSSMVPAFDSSSAADSHARKLYATAFEVGPENTVYVTVMLFDIDLTADTKSITWGGFIRCLDGTAASTSWDFVSSSLPGYGGLWTASIVAGSNNIFTIGYRYEDTGPGSDPTASDLRLLNYKDTLAGTAGSLVPASGAKDAGTISGDKVNVPLSWGNLSGTSYEWEVALDSNFDSIVASGDASKSSAIAAGLEMGTTYYWRVRATEPVAGKWSAATSFTTKSEKSGAPTLISPTNGDKTGKAPIFTWTAVSGATSYKIQAATDSGFTSLAVDKTATTTAYESDELDSDTYYWRVKAVTSSGDSDWSATGAFAVTDSADDDGSSTPAWVWVLIVMASCWRSSYWYSF